MGSRVSFDQRPSDLGNLINIHHEGSRLMREPAAPPDGIRHHFRIWRVADTAEGVQCSSVSMVSEDVADLQFSSTQAYIVLVITRLPQDRCSEALPVYVWATLQSMESITQQSMSTPIVRLSGTVAIYSDSNFASELYVFKGKWCKPLVSVRALGLAYELEDTLRRGGEYFHKILFAGVHVQKNKLSKSELFCLKKDAVTIPYGEALLSQLLKRGIAILARIYTGAVPAQQGTASKLPFNDKSDFKKLFKQKQTTFKLTQPVSAVVKSSIRPPAEPAPPAPSDTPEHPFLVEITEIMQGDDALIPPPPPNEQINMDDFQRELQESLAYRRHRQGKQKQFLQEQPEQLIEEPPNYSDNSMIQICQGLFISGEKAAYSLEQLKRNNITLVINVAADYCINRFPGEVEYLSFFCKDSQNENIESLFYPCIEKISQHLENKDAALVHCVRGVSRSAAIVAAYLILKKKLSYQSAQKMLRAKRPQASPNNGFMLQLINFDKRVNNTYDSQPFRPKVFGVSSYQQQSPNQIVVKHIPEGLFSSPANGLDPRGVFVIQHQTGVFVWRGSQCKSTGLYMEAAIKHVKYLQKYESAVDNLVTVNQGSQPADFWEVLRLPEKPSKPFKNASMLYLPVSTKHVPCGISNPQVLIFKLGSSTPLPHNRLSEKYFYLQCKEDKEGVRFVMWKGRKWKEDSKAQADFMLQIRDCYYNKWDDNDIMMHDRSYEFSDHSVIIEPEK